MDAVAAQVQTLVALRHFVAAFDVSHVVSKPTRLCITAHAATDVSSRETLVLVQSKTYSLHRERTLLDARNELPVATLRRGLFGRATTYSAYVRTEHEETPCSFTFTVTGCTTMRSEFTDLVSGQSCTMGCDGSSDDDDAISVWLSRGNSGSADARQTIARLTFAVENATTKDGPTVLLDVSAGVDRMMLILTCIGLLDKRCERIQTQQ